VVVLQDPNFPPSLLHHGFRELFPRFFSFLILVVFLAIFFTSFSPVCDCLLLVRVSVSMSVHQVFFSAYHLREKGLSPNLPDPPTYSKKSPFRVTLFQSRLKLFGFPP